MLQNSFLREFLSITPYYSNMPGFLIVNFGGPRDLAEVPEFLTSLLTDEDVIWTGWPSFFQKWFFKRIAKIRAKTLVHDYAKIGGKSPIYGATECIAKEVERLSGKKISTFHRYLPKTHKRFIEEIEASEEEKIIVFPMFPQFSYATTGSIARWFEERLTPKTCSKLFWVKSYFSHPLFVAAQEELIANFLVQEGLSSEDTLLFFSMHGLPQCFVCLGDPYEQECLGSYKALCAKFPNYQTTLAFQSKFGRGLWLKPYTDQACHQVNAKNVVFIPLSFTSDHIETLFEIEEQYLPIIRNRGHLAYRCPALNQQKSWVEAIPKILEESPLFRNKDLIRTAFKRSLCENKCESRSQAYKEQVKCRSDDPACLLK